MQLHINLVGLWVSWLIWVYSQLPTHLFHVSFTKKVISKGDPSSSSMLCREVVPQSAAQDARQAGWTQGSIYSKSRKPTPRQGCHRKAGRVGCPTALPAHPAGSTLAPRHRNPLPRSAKPGSSNTTSQAPLLAPEAHDTSLQIEDFLKW